MRARSARAWSILVFASALLFSPHLHSRSQSQGTAQDGTLVNGFKIPSTGALHTFAGPVKGRGHQFATLEAAALIARAARTVHDAAPGAPLVLGDCSAREGGRIPLHASHQSGRDLDILFYVTDQRGRSVTTPGFNRFSGAGRCVDKGCSLRLDVARTWWMVRTILASQRPAAQYLFVSEPIKRLLLSYARRQKEHPSILRRAESVLHQPRDAPPHDDHFHLRIYCDGKDREAGCLDTGPVWPWISPDGRAKAIRSQAPQP